MLFSRFTLLVVTFDILFSVLVVEYGRVGVYDFFNVKTRTDLNGINHRIVLSLIVPSSSFVHIFVLFSVGDFFF